MVAKTILVFDRDDEVRVTLRSMLETSGHCIVLATSTADLLTQLSKRQVDVILTNQLVGNMGMDYPLLRIVRVMQPRTAIILTTQWHGELSEHFHADAILPKPFTLSDLESTISAVVTKRGTIRDS